MQQAQHIVFLTLTILSHICASLFFAKPRFNKIITAVIWLLYGSAFFLLSPDRYINYFITIALHLILFFVTTTGRAVEKGLLFFIYATTYTCVSTLFNILVQAVDSVGVKVIFAFVLMAIMQFILYRLLLPPFLRIAKHIRKGWGKFYGVVLSFWVLVVGQHLLIWRGLINDVYKIICVISIVAFCFTYYVAIFSSMRNIVELSHEKQKSLQAELLQSQVEAQSNEAALVRQYRHDMRHHYQELLSMALEGRTEDIIDYIRLQSESIEAMTTGRFCENETINNILKVFNQKAAEQSITIDIRAAAKPNISVPPPSLVTVVANILENALHGAAQSKVKEPRIAVSVKHKAGRLVISCENSCSTFLCFEEMPEHLQGIGVQSIISTAEKYNGSCRFSANDGIFRCTVILDE